MIRALACLALCLTLGGCRHRQAAPTLPAVLKAPDVQPPTPDSPPMQSPPPESVSTAPQIKVTQTKPKRVPKKSAQKTTAPDGAPAPATPPPGTPLPSEAANAVPTAEGSIGALSAGGDASQKAQQDASELISSCEKQLGDALQTTKGQQPSLRKVQLFLKQAKQALSTGDAEGAITLATKAKLLLDDLGKET